MYRCRERISQRTKWPNITQWSKRPSTGTTRRRLGFETRFALYTEDEVFAERGERLYEAGAASAMMVLAAIEVPGRLSPTLLCEAMGPAVADAPRAIPGQGAKVSLSDNLLGVWKNHGSVPARLVGDTHRAFGYRDWLAHARYWVPKLGRQYDFASVYNLAQEVEVELSSQRSTN